MIRIPTALFVGVALPLFFMVGDAWGQGPTDHCGVGDTRAAFEALPVGVSHLMPNGISMAGLGEGVRHCQYRVFDHGGTFTFCEHDIILGGLTWLVDWKNSGMSRREAVALINTFGDRVYLARVGEDWQEQGLMTSAFKDAIHPLFGHLVYQSRGFIIQLAPGEYESRWESADPVFGATGALVRIVVLPHEIAH